MEKPRVFWIPWYTGGTKDNPRKVYVQNLYDEPVEDDDREPFIEKSAYDELVEELKVTEQSANERFKDLDKLIGEMKKERDEMKEEYAKWIHRLAVSRKELDQLRTERDELVRAVEKAIPPEAYWPKNEETAVGRLAKMLSKIKSGSEDGR